MDAAFVQRIETSFNALAPRGEELVDRFYANLFARHPQVRSLFPREMKNQKSKLLTSLVLVVKSLRNPEALNATLHEMGRRHVGYGVRTEHYALVRDTLLDTMAQMVGPTWAGQTATDWKAALDHVAGVMLEGQRLAAAVND